MDVLLSKSKLEIGTLFENILVDFVEKEGNVREGEIMIWCIGQKCIFRNYSNAVGLSMLK